MVIEGAMMYYKCRMWIRKRIRFGEMGRGRGRKIRRKRTRRKKGKRRTRGRKGGEKERRKEELVGGEKLHVYL